MTVKMGRHKPTHGPTNDEQTVDKLFSCAAKHNF